MQKVTLGISPLLVERQTIAGARRTLRMALSAARKGDERLAVSRGITAAVQAAVAGTRSRGVRNDADLVIQAVRELVQGIVLKRAVARFRKLG